MGKVHCCQFPNLGVWLDELQMLCLVEILSKYSPDTCVFVFFVEISFPHLMRHFPNLIFLQESSSF